MRDFIVIVKVIDVPTDIVSDELHVDYIEMDKLINEDIQKKSQSYLSEYKIDPGSRELKVINGKLCLVYLAFKPKGDV